MKYEKVKQLIHKYLAGECSPEEKGMLESWYINVYEQSEDLPHIEDYTAIENEILSTLRKQQEKQHHYILWKWVSSAAAILLFAVAAMYFSDTPNKDRLKNDVTVNQIYPANNKVYLTLSNGKRVDLTDNKSRELSEQFGVTIKKTADGQLIYISMPTDKFSGPLLYNKIDVPGGGQYRVQLPDGTKVWLNAATSLKYPSSFKGLNERKVELEGEAYFEVAHLKNKPFRVATSKQVVEVLGTRFNINSYQNETFTKTSLIEGSVKIRPNTGAPAVSLHPGQQASINDADVKVSNVDMEQVVAWKNGDFVFNGEDFQSVMRQIARWYNVDISYLGEMPKNTGFIGTISRKKKIDEILKVIEINQGVKIKLEGRRVIVMP